jgi:hypothetical protein
VAGTHLGWPSFPGCPTLVRPPSVPLGPSPCTHSSHSRAWQFPHRCMSPCGGKRKVGSLIFSGRTWGKQASEAAGEVNSPRREESGFHGHSCPRCLGPVCWAAATPAGHQWPLSRPGEALDLGQRRLPTPGLPTLRLDMLCVLEEQGQVATATIYWE